MATFNIVLDKRQKDKNGDYNLAVRVIHKEEVLYLNVAKLSLKKYEVVFIKKSLDPASKKFRDKCNGYISKCEDIYTSLPHFDRSQFRKLFFSDKVPEAQQPSLQIKNLFEYCIKHREGVKLSTKRRYRTSMNVFESFQTGLNVYDVTPALLKKFEIQKSKEECSIPTINSYLRDLRCIINYFRTTVKLIPKSYDYPFGKGGYSIGSFYPKKLVMSNEEIKSVANYTDFDNPKQEYARDIWLLLYRCNGINFADILRMRWSNIKGGYFVFFRMKTENTRKNNVKEIVAPITPKVQSILDKIGNTNSPFILGKLTEGYTESAFDNKSHKMRQQINRSLSEISQKLNLSVPLKLMTARDSYATTLKRAGKSYDQIGEMLGHSNSIVTMHYLGSMDLDSTLEVNAPLF